MTAFESLVACTARIALGGIESINLRSKVDETPTEIIKKKSD